MSNQQLLVIIVIAVVVGMTGIGMVISIQRLGKQSAQATVIAGLQSVSVRAHQFFLRPSVMGGGGRSFVGLTADAAGMAKLTTQGTNDNGTYTIATAGDASEVVIQGDGVGNTVQVKLFVRADVDDDSLVVVNR